LELDGGQEFSSMDIDHQRQRECDRNGSKEDNFHFLRTIQLIALVRVERKPFR
jgi:hypothetical protein